MVLGDFFNPVFCKNSSNNTKKQFSKISSENSDVIFKKNSNISSKISSNISSKISSNKSSNIIFNIIFNVNSNLNSNVN